jgi:thiosulfate/3-mercaptopyruvate sulfurtransferase
MDLPGPLVDADWLRQALESGEPLRLADVRWYPNLPRKDGYLEGHIPGAVYIDLDTELAAPVRDDRVGGRHPLPSPEAFARAMSKAGIGDETPVVVYDDAGGSIAARLWWMLHAIGHPIAVLDGGLQAWTGELETGEGQAPTPASFTPRPWPEDLIVDAEQVDRLRSDPDAVLLDVRVAERYRGDLEPLDPVAGHIPGARSVPWTEIVQAGSKRFHTPDEVRRRYAQAGVGDRTTTVVAQCGSGVMACQALLALEFAGIPGGRLYAGSWSDWISDPSRPVATGDDPEGAGGAAPDGSEGARGTTADGSAGR